MDTIEVPVALQVLAGCICYEDGMDEWAAEDCPIHGAELQRKHHHDAQAEIAAENAWLTAAEYDPRMDDPREW